jgi:hypothetical protein
MCRRTLGSTHGAPRFVLKNPATAIPALHDAAPLWRYSAIESRYPSVQNNVTPITHPPDANITPFPGVKADVHEYAHVPLPRLPPLGNICNSIIYWHSGGAKSPSGIRVDTRWDSQMGPRAHRSSTLLRPSRNNIGGTAAVYSRYQLVERRRDVTALLHRYCRH